FMGSLVWTGKRAPAPLLQALLAAGWKIEKGDDAIAVAWTSGDPLGSWPEQKIWIWLTDETPSVSAIREAVERGALDIICTDQPGWQDRLLRRVSESTSDHETLPIPGDFVAQSAAAKALLRRVAQAARTSMPVLLTGETGTGKELAAHLI